MIFSFTLLLSSLTVGSDIEELRGMVGMSTSCYQLKLFFFFHTLQYNQDSLEFAEIQLNVPIIRALSNGIP